MKCWPLAAQGLAGGVDGLHRAHGIELDARHLDQPADRVAGQAVVLHANLSGVLHLLRSAPPKTLQSAPTAIKQATPTRHGFRPRPEMEAFSL